MGQENTDTMTTAIKEEMTRSEQLVQSLSNPITLTEYVADKALGAIAVVGISYAAGAAIEKVKDIRAMKRQAKFED